MSTKYLKESLVFVKSFTTGFEPVGEPQQTPEVDFEKQEKDLSKDPEVRAKTPSKGVQSEHVDSFSLEGLPGWQRVCSEGAVELFGDYVYNLPRRGDIGTNPARKIDESLEMFFESFDRFTADLRDYDAVNEYRDDYELFTFLQVVADKSNTTVEGLLNLDESKLKEIGDTVVAPYERELSTMSEAVPLAAVAVRALPAVARMAPRLANAARTIMKNPKARKLAMGAAKTMAARALKRGKVGSEPEEEGEVDKKNRSDRLREMKGRISRLRS